MFSNFLQNKIKTSLCIYALVSTMVIPSMAASFEVQPLPNEVKSRMIEIGIWKPDCPVDIDRLRLVQFTHYDFFDQQQKGQIVVLDAVAERVMTIFRTLHQHKFPISQAKTIDEYWGQDKLSMVANNTSAFNHRPIAGKTQLSVHSYGVAIDINPIQNPCLEPKTITDPGEVLIAVQPAEGQGYLNRTNIRSGMVEQVLDASAGARVVELFQHNGFYVWGGNWNDPVDWQHFQPSQAAAEWLAFMSPKDATELFELYITTPTLLNEVAVRTFDFKSLYKKDPHSFMQAICSQKIMEMNPLDAYNSMLVGQPISFDR